MERNRNFTRLSNGVSFLYFRRLFKFEETEVYPLVDLS